MSDIPDKELFERTTVVKATLQTSFLNNPAEAVEELKEPALFTKWLNQQTAISTIAGELVNAAVNKVAATTGAGPAQLASKSPEEQQAAIEKTLAYVQGTRTLLESNFFAALQAIDAKGSPHNEEEFWAMQNLSVLYFFMLHPDIVPSDKATLTDADKKELNALFDEMRKFHKENPKPKNPDGNDFLKCFIEHRETKEAAAQLQSELPRLQSVLPAQHIIPNNLLANELQHGGIIGAGLLNLPALGNGKGAYNGNGNLITTSVIATYQPGEGVTIEGNYTEYDRQIQDAICSLWQYGNIGHLFTPAMVYRALTNNTALQPSPQQIGAVTRSIEKQRDIHVTVDASAELEKRGIKDADGKPIRFMVDDTLLSLKRLEVTAGGKTVKGYYIKEAPPLLEYSQLTGQLLTVKSELLDIRRIDKNGCICESIANTESRIAIKGYLLRRIEVLKHDIERAKDNFCKYQSRRENRSLPAKEVSEFIHQSNRILFDTLFAETGQESTNRKTQQRNREYALQCLEYWKAIGHITGYSIVKGERNAIKGINLHIK